MPLQPEPGDIILVRRGNGLFDKLVRFATVSPYFHAAMVVNDQYLVEARLSGVSMRLISEYAGRCDLLKPLGATNLDRAKATQFALSKLHLPYGWIDIIEDAERLGLHIDNGYRWRKWRHYDCSCLVAAAWANAGIRLTLAPAPTPGDLGFASILQGPRPWKTLNTPT